MVEIERIIDQLERTYRGEAWHGQSIRQILNEITESAAATVPMPGVHTIMELVLHMITWMNVVLRTLEDGQMPPDPTPEQNWPAAADAGPDAWTAALDELHLIHQRLIHAMGDFPDEDLNQIVPGKDFTWYVLLHGVIQHNLYHAGQIAYARASLTRRP